MSTYTYFWRVTTVVVFGCMFMGPVAHSQSRLQYSFVDVAYSQADVDDPIGGVGDLDADIIGISGSVAITDNLFIQAGYSKIDFDDVFGISLEADDIFLGVGWHNALTANTDIVFDVNYLYVDAEACAGGLCISDDDSGYGLDLGVRSLMGNDKVELEGGVGYADVGDGSGDFAVAGSARYHFTSAVSGAIGVAFSDDVTQYGVNLRFAW